MALLDNATGLNLRDSYTPTDASDYNQGQMGGDLTSIGVGIVEYNAGQAISSASTGAALAGGGVAAVPASRVGAFLQLHGAMNATNGSWNLMMQKGRVSAGGSEEAKPHGNTAGDQPASLYQKYDKAGNYQKTGVTQSVKTRYSKKQMAGGRLDEVESGPRREMLKKEREMVEKNPGPENHEPWAGKTKEEK